MSVVVDDLDSDVYARLKVKVTVTRTTQKKPKRSHLLVSSFEDSAKRAFPESIAKVYVLTKFNKRCAV